MLKHYAEFFYPGIMFTETGVKGVKSRDPSKVKAPKACFGYRFFDREEIKAGGETLVGKPKNYSGTYYFGKVMTLDDVKKEMPYAKTLIENMEENGWDKMVKTRKGNFQTFTIDDVILSE